jgi:hypothetical protein
MLGLAVLSWLDHLLRRAGRPDLALLTPDAAAFVVGVVSAVTVGARLASRRPAHPVGSALNNARNWPTSRRSVTVRPAGRGVPGARVTVGEAFPKGRGERVDQLTHTARTTNAARQAPTNPSRARRLTAGLPGRSPRPPRKPERRASLLP